MRIESIEIHNYRQYKSLSFDFKKYSVIPNDLNVIIAQNGVGKSNFLNAITWCLYEEESHLQSKSKALPIVNLDTLSKAAEKEKIIISVEMVVNINDRNETIRREATYIKSQNSSNQIVWSKTNILYIMKVIDPILHCLKDEVLEGDYANQRINQVFPKGISAYFFFDNEQMNNYFTQNEGAQIKQAINSITKVDLVNNVESRLQYLLRDYKTKLGVDDARISNLDRELQQAIDDEKAKRERLEKNKESLIAIDKELVEISEVVKGAEDLNVLENKRDSLLEKQDSLKHQIEEKKIKINEFIVRFSILLNMYPSFNKTLELIAEKDKQRQLPPEISKEILIKSENDKKCQVCGCDLDEEHLLNIIEKIKMFNVSNPVFELLLRIQDKVRDLKSEAEQYPDIKKTLFNEYNALRMKYEDVSNELVTTNNTLKTIAKKDEIKKALDKRDILISSQKHLMVEQGSLISQIQNAEDNTKTKQIAYDDAIRIKNKSNEKIKKYDAVQRLLGILNQVEKEIEKDIRVEISEETYKNFMKLIWKENTYSKIQIDEDYNVDLIHKNGMSAIGSTSAAERALLALSFTNAIHKVSGFETPLVIDSPVGRVSDENRKKFSESLATVSKEKQIIMLFTPDEYSKDVSDVFEDIAVISRASMDDSEEITTIKEI